VLTVFFIMWLVLQNALKGLIRSLFGTTFATEREIARLVSVKDKLAIMHYKGY